MTKKHFVALADAIKQHNQFLNADGMAEDNFTDAQIETLARFCAQQNPQFNKDRWVSYIRGECGPSGGAVKLPIGPHNHYYTPKRGKGE